MTDLKLICWDIVASLDPNMDVSAIGDQYEHAVISTVDVHAPVTSIMKTCRRRSLGIMMTHAMPGH